MTAPWSRSARRTLRLRNGYFAAVAFLVESDQNELIRSRGIDKAARRFTVEKLGPGVYRVTSQEDLTEGEYGFYNGSGAQGATVAKIFDFGIKFPR